VCHSCRGGSDAQRDRSGGDTAEQHSLHLHLPSSAKGGDKTMSTDYDAPRRTETDDVSEDSLEDLTAHRGKAQLAVVDVDESESAESFELPGADLSGEELSVRVIPKRSDEFTCSSCFLVHHRSRLASEKHGIMICTDCVA
jgi:hypothetical protein